jgi:catechol 2,3-dioxygenase-like lactoylglutathione lyase family enzyme
MKLASLAALASGLVLLAGTAAAAGPPAALRPTHVAGPAFYVTDLDAQKAWYMDKLGMSLARTMMREGKPFEYIMGLDDGADRAVLVLARSAQRPTGPNLFSRLILDVPNAKALAAHLKTQGIDSREAAPGVAYFIQDPEGNPIELYTPPKA